VVLPVPDHGPSRHRGAQVVSQVVKARVRRRRCADCNVPRDFKHADTPTLPGSTNFGGRGTHHQWRAGSKFAVLGSFRAKRVAVGMLVNTGHREIR